MKRDGHFRRAPSPLLLLLCTFLHTAPAFSLMQYKQIDDRHHLGRCHPDDPIRRLRRRPVDFPAAATRRDILLSAPAAGAVTSTNLSPEGDPSAPTAPPASAPFAYSATSVRVSGVDVPVSIWRPPAGSGSALARNPASYPYAIDIGRIAAKLRVGWLSWLPRFERPLPCGSAAAGGLPSGFARARPGDSILFAHGFLGSAWDFSHAAETLAADGFTVVAPELPESLTASYVPPEGMGREQIIDAAMRAEGGGRWGIFGHSAGAGSALTHPAEFALGRACLAGGAGRFAGYARGPGEPLFVCSSNGDGCNAFMGLADSDLRAVLDDGGTVIFREARDAYASPSARAPAKGAYVFASGSSPVEPLPCHISFLWEAVDDAMVDLLSPLLPLAKALGLFVLDFDVYKEQRDAAETAAVVLPTLRRFFLTNSARP